MGTMAKWLDHKFEVSPNLIRGFDNLQVKGSCESEEQENGMEKYVVWKNGKPMEISLTAHLSAALGCDVRNEAINFIAEANWGRKDYFYVYDNRGAWKLIMCQVMLMTANISKVSIAPNGKWLWADVALTMKQCGNSYGDTSVPGGAGNETDSGSGSGDYGGSGSGGGGYGGGSGGGDGYSKASVNSTAYAVGKSSDYTKKQGLQFYTPPTMDTGFTSRRMGLTSDFVSAQVTGISRIASAASSVTRSSRLSSGGSSAKSKISSIMSRAK